MQSVAEWAQMNFGACELGDKRRTNRLVLVAEQIGSNPSASLPNQIENWVDLKAAYRLFDCKGVSFEAIASPHWQMTKERAKGRTVVIGDTTEIDFGRFREIEGVGPTGNGTGKGFLLHNALMVNAESHKLIGIAGQAIHYRKPKRKSAKRPTAPNRLKKKDPESEVWGKVIDQIGPPAAEASYGMSLIEGRTTSKSIVICYSNEATGSFALRSCSAGCWWASRRKACN
jgi:Transposase DNA-binding